MFKARRLVPVAEILYLRAELKYVTVRTRERSHIYDGSLSDLETRYPERFVRVHRNALVAKRHVRGIVRRPGGECAVALDGVSRNKKPKITENTIGVTRKVALQRLFRPLNLLAQRIG